MKRLIFLITMAVAASALSMGQQSAKNNTPAKVVFVCEHGAAKSVLAAAELERMAKERGLNFSIVARGTNIDPELAPSVVNGLRADGLKPGLAKPVKVDLKHAPTFVPLDPFTVNLADREAERYAQVGITLELGDAKAGDLLKAYMPAIRNNILLALGSKTAAQLIERDGKLRLAEEIRREALRPLGFELPLSAGGAAKKAQAADHDDEEIPIRAVHFSNFIIQ